MQDFEPAVSWGCVIDATGRSSGCASGGGSREGTSQVGRGRELRGGDRQRTRGGRGRGAGGRNLGPRPMELVLAGAAACTAFDVVWILRKARQPVTDCTVEADAERAKDEPQVFTRIHLVYRVSGKGLKRAQVERAVKLSKEKYCSATIMLAKTAEISFEIVFEEA